MNKFTKLHKDIRLYVVKVVARVLRVPLLGPSALSTLYYWPDCDIDVLINSSRKKEDMITKKACEIAHVWW